MSNIWNDPFGLKLLKVHILTALHFLFTTSFQLMIINTALLLQCNKPKPPAEPEAPPPAPAPAPTCVPTFQYHSYNGYYPQPVFQQQIYLGNPYPIGSCHPVAPAPAPAPPPPAPHVHQCVACTEKNKCKACKKKEDEDKVWITVPTFCNPRTPRKGVFERQTIASISTVYTIYL